MKKLKLFDGKILEGELGHDNQTGWSIPNDVQSVEFEDGKVLINPDFDLESVKQSKIEPLQSKVIDLQIRLDAATKNNLVPTINALNLEITSLKAEIARIEAL
jgi:hypothetical protein